MSEPLLAVEGLHVRFWTDRGTIYAVNGISFDVNRGDTLGIVGESGCGKSVTALALLGILPRAGKVTGGTARFEGRDLLQLSDRDLRQIRGKDIAMVFQDPMTSLNPVLTIGRQLREAIEAHLDVDRKEAERRAGDLIDRVGIPSAKLRLRDYPHQFSGGMRQRAMIAMALACEPKLLIADEPTTALDVTIQAQILDLLRDLVVERDTALILITHDLGVVAGMCERVNVMYAGTIVETGSAEQLFARPRHPYTLGLLQSVPRLDAGRKQKLLPIQGQPRNMLQATDGVSIRAAVPLRGCSLDPGGAAARARGAGPRGRVLQPGARRRVGADSVGRRGGLIENGGALVELEDLRVWFPIRSGIVLDRHVGDVKAVDGVTLSIMRGETLGLVGESGCGKSTVGRTILRLYEPTGGRIRFDGQDVTRLSEREMQPLRSRMQMVFQDPFSSLNPRHSVGRT